MHTFFITLLIGSFTLFNAPSNISSCYYQHNQIGNYVMGSQIKQDFNLAIDIKYPVSEKHITSHTIIDGHTLVYKDRTGGMFAQLNIQMAAKKSFSRDVLTSFDFVEQHDHIKKIKGPITEQNTLNISGHQVYRTEAELSKVGNGGTYLYFPSERMAVYFQFYQGSKQTNLSDAELATENQNFIRDFLKSVEDCEKK